MVVPAAALLAMAPVEVLGELRRQPVEESGAAGLLQVLGGRRRRLKVDTEGGARGPLYLQRHDPVWHPAA